MKAIKLWLDDVRPTPDGWTRAHSVNEAKKLMAENTVLYASLDHDLGDFEPDGGDGPKFTDWCAEMGRWPVEGIRVHSSNPSGVRTMLATIDRYGCYDVRYSGDYRGASPADGWPPIG